MNSGKQIYHKDYPSYQREQDYLCSENRPRCPLRQCKRKKYPLSKCSCQCAVQTVVIGNTENKGGRFGSSTHHMSIGVELSRVISSQDTTEGC